MCERLFEPNPMTTHRTEPHGPTLAMGASSVYRVAANNIRASSLYRVKLRLWVAANKSGNYLMKTNLVERYIRQKS